MQFAFDPTDEWITAQELKAAPLDMQPIVAASAVPAFVFVLLPVLLLLLSLMILVIWYMCDLEFVDVADPPLSGKVIDIDIDSGNEEDGNIILSRDVSLCRDFSLTSLAGAGASMGVDLASVALNLPDAVTSPIKKNKKKFRRKSFS